MEDIIEEECQELNSSNLIIQTNSSISDSLEPDCPTVNEVNQIGSSADSYDALHTPVDREVDKSPSLDDDESPALDDEPLTPGHKSPDLINSSPSLDKKSSFLDVMPDTPPSSGPSADELAKSLPVCTVKMEVCDINPEYNGHVFLDKAANVYKNSFRELNDTKGLCENVEEKCGKVNGILESSDDASGEIGHNSDRSLKKYHHRRNGEKRKMADSSRSCQVDVTCKGDDCVEKRTANKDDDRKLADSSHGTYKRRDSYKYNSHNDGKSHHSTSSCNSSDTNKDRSHKRSSWHHVTCEKMKNDDKKCTCPKRYHYRSQVDVADLHCSYVRKLPKEARDVFGQGVAPRVPWFPHPTTMKLKHHQYFRVVSDRNGGSTVCHLYMDEISHLDDKTMKEIGEEFIKLSYQEDDDGNAFHVIGIVHNGADYLPDLLEYMADHYPHLPVKVGSLKGPSTQSTSMGDYRDDVYKTYANGTFRYAPLQEVSLCGTQGEEVGAYFPDLIKRLEKSPFMQPVMPWGPMSAMKSDSPLQSNDGPIFWVRPGEQTLPSSGTGRSQGRLQKGACRLSEERAALFEDRTKPHGDHSGSYENAAIEPVCAVGVLRAVNCGHEEHKGRATKDVIAFNANEYYTLLDVLQIDRFEPPLTQCTQWLDVSRLNMLRRQGITYAHLQLHDGDVYYLPRKVVHQFQTISAVASIAWHVRYHEHCEPLTRPEKSFNKGAVYHEKEVIAAYRPPKPIELDTIEEEMFAKVSPRKKNRRRSECEIKTEEDDMRKKAKCSKPASSHKAADSKMATPQKAVDNKMATPQKAVDNKMATPQKAVDNKMATPQKAVDSKMATPQKAVDNKTATPQKTIDIKSGIQFQTSESTPHKSTDKCTKSEKPVINVLQPLSPVESRHSLVVDAKPSIELPPKTTPASFPIASDGPSMQPAKPRAPGQGEKPLKENREIKKRKNEKGEEKTADVLGSIMSQMKKAKLD